MFEVPVRNELPKGRIWTIKMISLHDITAVPDSSDDFV